MERPTKLTITIELDAELLRDKYNAQLMFLLGMAGGRIWQELSNGVGSFPLVDQTGATVGKVTVE